jgi:hypothetical protein
LRADATRIESGFVEAVAVVVAEPARRPVRLRRIAPARAVQRRDVLQRDEDVPVQLDVRDLFDRAIGGEDALLILAAEERDLDLLALVLVGVILDAAQRSRFGST